MQNTQSRNCDDFSSFEKFESADQVRGMNDWAVPWSDLMMVMFVLFVVLFVYASSHQDVKVLFSEQSAGKAQATSTLDPLIGLIGQISSRADGLGNQDVVRVAEKQVIYRSREDGVSIIREGQDRIRVSLRGELFFEGGNGRLKPESAQYLAEIAEVVQLSVGSVHVVGFASQDEANGTDSFSISTDRAAGVANHLITEFGIEPRRVVITGRGAYMPELPDTSETNLALNRRVEIVITNEI